jgi:drug/metabolite transporter (DMT)-like permease
MDPLVAAAVLAASLLHASWHALIKTSGDRVTALAGMNLVSGCAALALVPFAKPLPLAIYALIAVSVLLHASYKLALARLYRDADLSQAYPLARGVTPIMAAALAFAFVGEKPGAAIAAGIVCVCGGLALLAFERGGRRPAPAALLAAAVVGFTVAAYSVIDAYGIRRVNDWFSFTVWLVALDSGAFVLYAIATRGRAAFAAWRAQPGRVAASGLFGVASFGVFMWALGRAPVGAVSALRETSVIFAALIGTLLLREPTGWQRYAAAAAVTLGVAIIALTR